MVSCQDGNGKGKYLKAILGDPCTRLAGDELTTEAFLSATVLKVAHKRLNQLDHSEQPLYADPWCCMPAPTLGFEPRIGRPTGNWFKDHPAVPHGRTREGAMVLKRRPWRKTSRCPNGDLAPEATIAI